jgi:hypothetical protein
MLELERAMIGLSGMVRRAQDAERVTLTPSLGFPRTPNRMISFTPIPGHLGNVGIIMLYVGARIFDAN